MITYNQENQTFTISNHNISLVIYLNSESLLETVYFGKSINDIDLEKRKQNLDNYSTCFYDNKIGSIYQTPDCYSSKRSLMELGVFGGGDNRPAPIVVKKQNGMIDTIFHYVSYNIYRGFPKYENGPHVTGENAETIEFLLKDQYSDVYIKYNVSILLDKDIIVKNVEFINKGKDAAYIKKAMSLNLDLDSNDYVVHHFAGLWANERREKTNDVVVGEQILSSSYGRSSHEENPFFFIASKTNDEVIGFNLVYSGNFKASIYSDYCEKTRIIYGINDLNFEWTLNPGDNFVTPQAVISYSNQGVDKMSQNFHKFISDNIVQYNKNKEYKEILFNSWEGTTFNFTTESIISYIDDSIKIGSELFVLDDGWFGHNRNDDVSSLGDWFVNEKKIDLGKVVDYVHEKGLKFGLWFEPEMVNPDSDTYRNHREYVIGGYNEHQTLHRNQFVLDFTNEEVVNYVFDQMCKILDKYQIEYIKWDMNRDLKEYYIPALGPTRQGEMFHRYTLGYYSLIEKLLKRYPDLMIEGCASGGGRFDLGTLYYCPQIWASDNTSPGARMYINYNTSLGYPLSTIGSHVSNNDQLDYYGKAILALFGTYGYEMNPNKLSQKEIDEISKIAQVYKQYHRNVFLDGDLYHLCSPEHEDAMVAEVTNGETTFVISMGKPNKKFERNIPLKGLNETSIYLVDGEEYMGKKLLEEGILISHNLDAYSIKLISIIKK